MTRPRALFDANLYLNFLLSPDPVGTAVDQVIDAAAAGAFQLLLAEDVVAEVRSAIVRRPYLSARIRQLDLDALVRRLQRFATLLGPLEDAPPAVSRDPGDDYLLMLAVLHDADYIVTRDRDLLALGEVAGVHIVDPVAFLEFLRAEAN